MSAESCAEIRVPLHWRKQYWQSLEKKKQLESDASNVSVRQSQGEADRMIDFVVRLKEIVIIIN